MVIRLEWGWNVALAVKPIEKLNISATYRSNVDLDFEDTARPEILDPLDHTYDAEVSVPVPAVFALSVAYDVLGKSQRRTYLGQNILVEV